MKPSGFLYHSCTSLHINNDTNVILVTKFLGHTKIEETLNTYYNMFNNRLNNIIGLIDNLNENSKKDYSSNINDNCDYKFNKEDDFELSI